MKRLISFVFALLILIPSFAFAGVCAQGAVTVFVDGTMVEFDVAPQIINDRTMVPMRAIFEQIGAEVTWDDSTKTAISQKGDITVKIAIGEYKLNKNGVDIAIDVPAQIVDSRTLVPVRAISESFDCEVFWDDATRSVRVVTLKLSAPVLTENDNAVVCTIGEEKISKATYNLYAAMTALSDENSVIDVIKTYEAMYKYHTDNGVPMAGVLSDVINTQIHKLVNGDAYAQLIAQYNTTDAALRDYLEKSYFITYAQAFEPIGQYTDAQIAAYARANYVRTKHILVKDKTQAEKILAELKSGASFEEMVKEYSIDSMDVETGYVFGKGRMVKSFEEKSFELAEGEISELVVSEYGYHIIKKYPMSEITDEYIVKNFGEDICAELDNLAYQANVKAVLEQLTVSK